MSPTFLFKSEYIKAFCQLYYVSSNIYLLKVHKRNIRRRRRSNVFIPNSEHNSHHFRVAIAELLENIYLDSFFWLWNYIQFFQTIKCCCQVHVQATSLFKIISVGMFQEKSNFFVTFRVCYITNNLACLGGYLTCLEVAGISNLFYFHFMFTWSRAMTRLPRSNWTSLARRLCEFSCTNLTKS